MSEFALQLSNLGYKVIYDENNRVVIEYEIPAGRFLGQIIALGFEVPDFPLNPPGGLHISPRILPINGNQGGHPVAVADSPFDGTLGLDWEYWSRPFSGEWPKSNRSARVYMEKHVLRLFETQ